MIALRTYQQRAIDAVLEHWNKNASTLVVSATGTGKTETFLGLVTRLEAESESIVRTLILVHRDDLVRQIVARIQANWPELEPGVVAEGQEDYRTSLTVATVQSMQRRIATACAYGAYTHIVIDEAHHATANSYTEIIAICRAANPSVRLVGFTATPKRTDKQGLSKVFDTVAFRFGIAPAIAAGALVPFRALGFRLDGDLDAAKQTDTDYDEAALVALLDYGNALDLAIEKYREHGESRQAILFAPTVAYARKAAAAFSAAGITAETVSAETPSATRELIYARFRSGATSILCNCFLLTEGMDFPAASLLLQLRPTKSDIVYVQMAGRVLRTAPGKLDAMIMDFVPESHREMVLAGDLLGKPKAAKKVEKKAEAKGVLLESFSVTSNGEGIDAEPDQLKVAILDYLASSVLTWTLEDHIATASLGNRALAVLMPDAVRIAKADAVRASGQWQPKFDLAYERIRYYHLYLVNKQDVTLLSKHESWEAVQQAAMAATEEYLTESDLIIAATGKRWRKEPPSDKQIALLQKFGRNTDGLDKGKASQLMTHVFTCATLRRKGIA